jgi:ATP-binding cassette subfamily B protein
LTLGDLSLFLSLAWGLNGPMNLIGTVINDYQRFLASAEKIMTIYYAKPDIETPVKPYKPRDPQGNIEFRGVTYKYPSGKINVLENVNLKASAGQTIGIMGPTGCGKSTLVSLIPRFMDTAKGTIFIDGVDVRKYDLNALRHIVGMSMQDVFLFSETIDANIAYGEPDMPEERAIECAVDADADSFIRRMPEGYETVIGERGVGLSGGQKQRIALARALAYDTPILILDDTTSAVDMDTEAYIQERLRARKKKSTTLIVAQRVSSVKEADCIYILEDGKVSEFGTHEELVRKRGYYYSVYCLQNGITPEGGEQ